MLPEMKISEMKEQSNKLSGIPEAFRNHTAQSVHRTNFNTNLKKDRDEYKVKLHLYSSIRICKKKGSLDPIFTSVNYCTLIS